MQPDGQGQAKLPNSHDIKEQKLYLQLGLKQTEYDHIVEIIGKNPNWTELGIFSVMWSEHCSYKHSKKLLQMFPTSGEKVLQGPGEGAGIIDIGDGQAVVFKIESHNHPTAVEPFQGAATGVGGIIRDIFSMGARPVALLNSLRFGSLSSSRACYLFSHAVDGIAHYGNCIGIPNVGGEVMFDHIYEGNPLVNAMCVGIVDHNKIQKGVAKGVGNLVVYIGASTGRDGIHGATFASEELGDNAQEKRPAVQVGDPFMQKLLLEACLEMVERDILIGMQDMGAAGITSSTSEMASKGKHGVRLNLDKVPQRESGMSAYEMMLSESQERMVVVITRENEPAVKEICERWGLPCAIIGEVTEGIRYEVYHRGVQVVDLPVTAIAEAPLYKFEVKAVSSEMNQEINTEGVTAEQALKMLLSSPTVGCKRSIYQQYDHMVGTSTAVVPGSDAGIIKIRSYNKALAVTTDGNARYVYLDPLQGGRIAVAEAARNIVCAGAKPLGLTNCLNFGNPEKPEIYTQLANAIKGMSEACKKLDIPVIGGNVSLYNETNGVAIYPTPVVGMVGLIEDMNHITTSSFKAAGDVILLLGNTLAELAGSELQSVLQGKISGYPPVCDLEKEDNLQQLILMGIRKGYIKSAHDCSEGGLGISLAESCIIGKKGAVINLSTVLPPIDFLFSESQSRAVITVQKTNSASMMKLARSLGVECQELGKVTDIGSLTIYHNSTLIIDIKVSEMTKQWEEAIPCLMTD